MKTQLSVFIAAAACAACADATMKLPVFGTVKVLDSIDCTQKDHDFREYPQGGSRVEKILDRDCRVMPVLHDESSFFSYRLGKGKGLKANGSYVVVLDYPDDLPRNYVIINRATDSHRGFSTGTSFGDAWEPAHIDNHNEMISVAQSGQWEQWTCYTSLQSWTVDCCETKGPDDKTLRLKPEDGFDLVVSQYSRRHDPFTKGIAVSKIILCELPDEAACYAKPVLPPSPLPQRHLFWREEMSDGAALQGGADARRCADQLDWLRHKCRQMKILGMNTYMKDLLEFGHVQHWDPDYIRGGWAWGSEDNPLWERVVNMVSKEYGFGILPYYEWFGNFGAEYMENGQKVKAYGNRKTSRPLNGKDNYTHIWWSEKGNIDVTDPLALQATKELFQGTILRFKGDAKFVGAMFRNRPAAWPVGFGDDTRARFGKEKNGGNVPSRDDLKNDKALYNRYLDWWYAKRAQFLDACAEYLRSQGIADAKVFLDAEAAESGPGFSGVGGLDVISDDPAATAKAFQEAGDIKKAEHIISLDDAVAKRLYFKGRSEPASTWGDWEWQHACPADRPQTFPKSKIASLAMPVNRMASVMDPEAYAAYADANGCCTMIRHQSLNEHNMHRNVNGKQELICGYDMSDTEKAGRASMMIEVEAMAKGDPANIGYFIGSCFARGFPGPVREFNLNYLALPALPSQVVKGACSDPDVTVRKIDCSRYGKASYYMLVHTGKTDKSDVKITLPGVKGLKAAVSGKTFKAEKDGSFTFPRVRAWQLVTFTAE